MTPVEDQNFAVSGLGGVENVYSETASKFFVWLTGTVEQAHYEPIGEVANYFGFAVLRTEIRERGGEGADEQLRGPVYREVLELFDDPQRTLLYELLDAHRTAITAFLSDRINLIEEFWGMKQGRLLNLAAVDDLMYSIGEYEGEITVLTAQYYARIMELLTDSQLQYLRDIRNGVVTIEQMQNSTLAFAAQADAQYENLSDEDQELMTEVASKIVAWATGDLAVAVFLPGGKIENFFGFASYRYVDRAGVSRGTAAGYVDQVLTPEQQAILGGLAINVVDYTNDYIDGRAELITTLDALKGDVDLDVAGSKSTYAAKAGIGEGRRATVEALTFHLIESMMSETQLAAIRAFR